MLHPCPGRILFELTPYLESSFFLHNLLNLQISFPTRSQKVVYQINHNMWKYCLIVSAGILKARYLHWFFNHYIIVQNTGKSHCNKI